MSYPNHYDLELEALQAASADKWFMQEYIDAAAFADLYGYLQFKSESLVGHSTLSKQIVRALLDASKALEAAGEHQQANQFSRLLDLMARNEAASERQPGVPRIL